MEAEVKNNVTTKQTNHNRKEKKKCTKYEFSLGRQNCRQPDYFSRV